MIMKLAIRGERFRAMGATACLLAAILLYMPLFAATWQARGMNCCNGTECAAHGHAASKHGTKAGTAMECANVCSPALMDCKISCCEKHDRPMNAGMVFVMPAATRIVETMQAEVFRLHLNTPVLPFIVGIPSPPPRA
jgi:hypothetical protein